MYDNSVIDALLRGAVGVLPTDTVYGLVCRAEDERAVERLYRLKSREMKPGTLTAGSVDQLVSLGIPKRYFAAATTYWPGAVSVVIPMGQRRQYLHQSKGSIAIRIPADEQYRQLLLATGPLLTSSANLPGEPTSETIDEARGYFGETVDFYVDGGALHGRPPSTVVRIVDDEIEVLRQGAVLIT